MRAYTHGGWAHIQRVSKTFLTLKSSDFFLVLLTGFEPQSYDLESDALLIEPPRHKSSAMVTRKRGRGSNLSTFEIIIITIFRKRKKTNEEEL